jgi:hypothetical protein
MSSGQELPQAGKEILKDAEDYCDRAHRELDRLNAWGKEPIITEGLIAKHFERQQTSYHQLPRKILKAPPPLPRLPRQINPKTKLQPSPESKLADLELPAGMDEALGMAHAEDIEAWQKAIADVMPATGSVKFRQLLSLTKLEPVELLIGLLLGPWSLEQQGFYGEIEISHSKSNLKSEDEET